MILFKKKTAPALSEALADRMLENIFDACQAEPNTIPLNTLISYTVTAGSVFPSRRFFWW